VRRPKRPSRSNLLAFALVAVLVVSAGIVLTGLYVQHAFHPAGGLLGTPTSIPLCGRDFTHPEGDTRLWSRADIDAAMQPGFSAIVLDPTIGRIPLLGVFAQYARLPQGETCAMVIWLRVGPDAYLDYALSGGP
jgi:hypothetical protein